jgi:hypothetical protein
MIHIGVGAGNQLHLNVTERITTNQISLVTYAKNVSCSWRMMIILTQRNG